MWRKILAGVGGYIGWWVIGVVGFVSMRVLWNDYATVESAMTFSLSMQIARLSVAVVCSLGAGIIVSLIARRQTIVPWVLGTILVIQFLPVHYNLWTKFPIWYHLFFLLTIVPLIVLGSRWALSWTTYKPVPAAGQSI